MTMNRATFLTTVLGGAFALPRLSAAETATEKVIYDLLDESVDALITGDFLRLVTLFDPRPLRMFRNHVSVYFDHALKYYSLAEISAISGLPAHPKDLPATDAELFVEACNSAKERDPEIVGNPKLLPISVHGTIFDNERLAHVLYSYSGTIESESTHFAYVAPRVFTARRERGPWRIYTCLLARNVGEGWWQHLAKQRREGTSTR